MSERSASIPAPILSAVVIAQNDLDRIGPALEALVGQCCSDPYEVIFVDSGDDGSAEYVRGAFPGVRVVHLAEPALPGRARNAGLALARGEFVSFPGSHVRVGPGFFQHRIDAHRMGFALVTGSVLNGTATLSGWASYFMDHSEALPGRPSEALDAAPSHCSYTREALLEVGGFPEDRRTGEDTVVNRELFRRGHKAGRSSKLRFTHATPCRNPMRLVRHHFVRGVGYGRILREAAAPRSAGWTWKTVAWLVLRYPPARIAWITRNVFRWGGPTRRLFVASFPLLVLGVLSAAAGAVWELLRAGAAPSVR